MSWHFYELHEKCQPFEEEEIGFLFLAAGLSTVFVYPYIVFYIYFLSEEVNGSERSNKNWMILEMGKEIIVFISTVVSEMDRWALNLAYSTHSWYKKH